MSGSGSGRRSGWGLPWRGLGEVQEAVQELIWDGSGRRSARILGRGLGGVWEKVCEGSGKRSWRGLGFNGWLAGWLAEVLNKHTYLKQNHAEDS